MTFIVVCNNHVHHVCDADLQDALKKAIQIFMQKQDVCVIVHANFKPV